MPSYNFNTVNESHKGITLWYIPPVFGIYTGFVLGFFITLAKSPPFILADCLYGGFLGFLLILSYNLFVLSYTLQQSPDPWPRTVFERVPRHPVDGEMQRDHARLNKNKYIFANPEDAPISTRTRSNKQSLFERMPSDNQSISEELSE
jgi:hypothetical protein